MSASRVTLKSMIGGLLLLSLTAIGSAAADSVVPVGHWQGLLRISGVELEIVLDLDRDADGEWRGYFDVPQQRLSDLELSELSIEEGTVAFKIPKIPGEPTFSGTLSEDGAVMAGTFSQAGQEGALRLDRKSTTAEAPAPVDPAVAEWIGPGVAGEGAAGGWRGALFLGSTALRLELRVSVDQEGTYSGALESVDQGSMAINADRVLFFLGSLRFEIASLSASFVGTLSADGSEVVGEWQQGIQKLPLTFRRLATDG